jgi:hypothetical protein
MRKLRICALIGCVVLISLVIHERLPDNRALVLSSTYGTEAHGHLGYVPNLYAAYMSADGRIFGIADHFLYVSEDGGRLFRQLGVLPKANLDWVDKVKDHVARSKLVRTFRRNPGPTNVVVLSSGTILVFYDHIYRSIDNGLTFDPVFSFSGDAAAPFSHGEGVALGPDDTVYFGEYLTTPRPHQVRVFRGSHDGTEWDVVHTFFSGEIFHVHSIQYDPYRSRYWITTGDSDVESKVLYTDDNFKSIQLLGGGSQDWRVVSLMITNDNLYWGSDNDHEPAGIFRWNFGNATFSKMQEIGKPSYFSTVLKNNVLILSTTYEPESQYVRRYRPEPTTDLWASADGNHWVKLLSLPYETHDTEWGPSRASIAFPGGAGSNELLFTPLSTTGDKYDTHLLIPHLPAYQDAAKS